ncbi:MAG TPA: glycosyltransferase, partial [Rhodopila sp.]|nr:glycosyltransferase [Rhodopila sp.]
MEAPSFLVYRDILGVPSELGFMRRQYVGFTRLRPIWIGRTVLGSAGLLRQQLYRLGDRGFSGPTQRLLFRHFGWVPYIPFKALQPVVHAQFARGGALALPIARKKGAGLVVTLHGGDVSKQKNWRHTLLSSRWPALLEEVKQFVCVSEAVAEIAAGRGVPPSKLTVLPIGAEIPEIPPERHPSHYLFVGRFVEKKGIAVLADAMRRLRASGDTTPLVCVGDGPMRPLLAALAAEVSGIELTGWLKPNEVAARMRDAVTLVVPSVIAASGDAEGLPSVIPEAMAQACPVIASAQGGMAEAVIDGASGLLTPPGDAPSLAEAMRRLSADRETADRLGLAGLRHAAETLNAQVQS